MAGRKLFQHIITESDVKGGAEKIKAETFKVFRGRELFEGLNREYTPRETTGDKLPTESKEVVTTVEERLDWTEKKLIELFDFGLVKDVANTKAVADLVVGNKTIATNLPATFLLALEKWLREVREMYDTIPTIDMSKVWSEGGRKGIRKHGPSEQYRTAKTTIAIELSPSTDKHPAQVKAETVDKWIGTFLTTYFSGAAHPREKAEILGNVDLLIEAVKRARMKANEVEVGTEKIGAAIFDFIHGRST